MPSTSSRSTLQNRELVDKTLALPSSSSSATQTREKRQQLTDLHIKKFSSSSSQESVAKAHVLVSSALELCNAALPSMNPKSSALVDLKRSIERVQNSWDVWIDSTSVPTKVELDSDPANPITLIAVQGHNNGSKSVKSEMWGKTAGFRQSSTPSSSLSSSSTSDGSEDEVQASVKSKSVSVASQSKLESRSQPPAATALPVKCTNAGRPLSERRLKGLLLEGHFQVTSSTEEQHFLDYEGEAVLPFWCSTKGCKERFENTELLLSHAEKQHPNCRWALPLKNHIKSDYELRRK